MKRMLFNATYQEELRVATVDGQRLINFDIETSSKTQRRGNIYKGVITRVEASLEACFVDYGTEKQGFLPFKEINQRYLPETTRSRDSSKLSVGMELIIQIEKDERGNKGAALTTFVSLPGRYLVLMPNSSRSGGISRRIDGQERDELKTSLSQVTVPDGMSIIARTAALGRVQEELQWDLNYLCNLWDAIITAAQSNTGSFLIYQESSLVIRSIRDHFSPDISEILIDMPDIFEQAKQFMAHVMPVFVDRIKLYHDDVPLFSRFQIEHQIESAYGRIVTLPSGGSIAIDHTEALTAIDVNSAKANKGADIEATALAANLEAAEEVARQLRLRDLGGLVVVDFIDMENIRNQREVENYFKQQLGLDRARIQMGKLSRFGLLELSRQRLSASLDESTAITCPRCDGIGTIRGTESSALHILRIVQEEAIKGHNYLHALHVQLPVSVATYLLNEKRDDVAKIESRLKIKVVLIPNVHLESPNYKVRKITADNADGIAASKVSYNLVENIDETAEFYQANSKRANQADVKAVVKNLTPAQMAPIIAGRSFLGNLVTKLIKIFSNPQGNDTAAALTQASTKGHEQRQTSRNYKGNKPRPVGLNRSNHEIQTVRPNSKAADEATPEKPSAPRNAPRNHNTVSGSERGDSSFERNRRPVQAPRPAAVAASAKAELPTLATTTKPTTGAINQQWQATVPTIVSTELVNTPPPRPVETPAKVAKVVANTITQAVDLGVLQMVATDQHLAKNIIVPEVKTKPNGKRFNDIVPNQTPYVEQANYELVETKRSDSSQPL